MLWRRVMVALHQFVSCGRRFKIFMTHPETNFDDKVNDLVVLISI